MTSPDPNADPNAQPAYNPYGVSEMTPQHIAATSLADNLSYLQDNHPWIEPETATVLASSASDHNDLISIAEALRDATASAWTKSVNYFSDPVLTKEDSPLMAVRQYVSGSIGGFPVATQHVSDIQASLQAKGFGADLPTDGMWGPDWQAALGEQAQKHYEDQMSGDKPGAITSGGFMHSLMSALTPSGIANSVVGLVKSIPQDLQEIAGNSAGLVSWVSGIASGVVQDATDGGSFNIKQDLHEARDQARDTDVFVQRHLGRGDYTKEQEIADTTGAQIVARTVNNLSTVLLLSGLGSAAGGVAKLATKETAAGLFTRDIENLAAKRAPGVIARTMVKNAGQRAISGAAIGAAAGGVTAGVSSGGDLGSIATGLGVGAVSGAALGALAVPVKKTDGFSFRGMPNQVVSNFPLLGKAGPVVGRFMGDEGHYYKARNWLATPYQFGAVRLAGGAMTLGQVQALKTVGVTGLENQLGGGAIQQNVDSAHVLDPINELLRSRTSFHIGGLSFAPDLDYLTYVLHGPMKANTAVGADGTGGSASALLGDSVGNTMAHLDHALGETGIKTQFQQALGSKGYKDFEDSFQGNTYLHNKSMAETNREAAVTMYAERAYADLRRTSPGEAPEMYSPEWRTMLGDKIGEAWLDPKILKQAEMDLNGLDDNDSYLTRFIQSGMAKSLGTDKSGKAMGAHAQQLAGDSLTHGILDNPQFINTPRSREVPLAGLDPDWAAQNPHLTEKHTFLGPGDSLVPGSTGLALATSKDFQDVGHDIQDFNQLLTEANAITGTARDVARNGVSTKIAQYLRDNRNDDMNDLSVFANQPEKLLEVMKDFQNGQPVRVFPTNDAPQNVLDSFSNVAKNGYKVVAGQHIGHQWRTGMPSLADVGKELTKTRRVVSSLGLNTQHIGGADTGTASRLRFVQSLVKLSQDPTFTMPNMWSIHMIVKDLQNEGLLDRKLGTVANTMFGASTRLRAGAERNLVGVGAAKDLNEAEAMIKSEIANAGGMQSLSHKEVTKVLTRNVVPTAMAPRTEDGWIAGESVAGKSGLTKVDEPGYQLFSDRDASRVYKALVTSYANAPTYQVGLAKLDGLMRASLFGATDAVGKIPGFRGVMNSPAAIGMASLPVKLAQFRDTYRFQLSPMFSIKRIYKVNVKQMVDGVTPSLTPVKDMMRAGTYDADHALLDRIQGAANPKYKYLDDADRYLNDSDVFGLFNGRHYEARYAGQKKAAGATDEEIHDGLVRVFHYGAKGREGRTALERSTNAIFFPFSFEKTIARNIGGYLLDKPAQAMVISNAMDAYRDFNNNHQDNPFALKWIDEHMPLLHEVLKLNTFAHGISMGEFGGINAPILKAAAAGTAAVGVNLPLLNAFMPQSWEATPDMQKTLMRFIPAVKDLQRIAGEGTEQGRIIMQGLSNGRATLSDWAQGRERTALQGLPSTKTAQAQQNDARVLVRQLNEGLHAVIQYNDGQGGDDTAKYHFGTGEGIPANLKDVVVNKAAIKLLVQNLYPAYDPNSAVAYATQNIAAAKQYITSKVGTPEYPMYQEFYKRAETAVAHMRAEDYKPEQGAAIQEAFRKVALEFASRDPSFVNFYHKNFASAFGPLENIQ